jgi:hypothetical protein
MTKKIQISIPTPCHEDWDKMSTIEKGKFCGSCQKNVYDFTKSSDREILNKFHKEKNLCGRFLPSQLNRDISVPTEKSTIWMAAATGVLTLLGAGNNDVHAQVKGEAVHIVKPIEDNIVGKPNDPDEEHLISGIIYDSYGPLANADLIVKGTSLWTRTDADGKFALNVAPGKVVVCGYHGLEQIEFIITAATFYKMRMEIEKPKSYQVVFGSPRVRTSQ